MSGKLYTAPAVAAFCQVDLKTIHNWCARGDIPFFRTPGKHLRFHAADVARFLTRYGYELPEELSSLAFSRTVELRGTIEEFDGDRMVLRVADGTIERENVAREVRISFTMSVDGSTNGAPSNGAGS